jgi:hypothetical protein
MNVGASELLVIFTLVAIVVIVVSVAFAGRGKRSASGTPIRHHSALVHDATPEAYIQRATLALAGLSRHQLSGVGGSTLIVTRSYTAGWRVVVAVLLFPIGLLALFGHDVDTATVAAARDGDHVRVTLSGAFAGAAIDRLNTTLN